MTLWQPKTQLLWGPAARTDEDHVFEIDALAAANGRIGDRADLETTNQLEGYYEWMLRLRFQAGLALDDPVYIYANMWDDGAAWNQGDFGSSDAAVSSQDHFKNCERLGVLLVNRTGTGDDQVASGRIFWPHKYFQPGIWSPTGNATTSATTTEVEFLLTPLEQAA